MHNSAASVTITLYPTAVSGVTSIIIVNFDALNLGVIS